MANRASEEPADLSTLRPGAAHYRAYVGPPLDYDLIGASQFRLLTALGLRSFHRCLDLGRGSLRAGRLLIPYLEPGNYFGIEPNMWLVDDAVRLELGRDILQAKQPRFDKNSDFNCAVFGVDLISSSRNRSSLTPARTCSFAG